MIEAEGRDPQSVGIEVWTSCAKPPLVSLLAGRVSLGRRTMMLRVVIPTACSRGMILFGLTALTLASSQVVEAADPLSQADQAFLAWDVQIEIPQRDMGRLAEKRGWTAEVRALGTYLVDQHQQA
jgi:hypothetical protein